MKTMPKFDLTLSAATLLLCCLLGCIRAERDFNFNDSQVPLLEPRDEPLHTHYHQDPYAIEISRCHTADSEVILSLVLKNHDWSDLSDNKKAKVLEKLSKFFAIPKEFIVMESVTKYDLSEMQKDSIRQGKNKCHSSNKSLGRVSFVLGCGATYFTISEPITKQIGAQVKDGSLNNITGERFGWWVIWRKHFKTRAQRSRRQVEGSGEEDLEDDDYEYGDDEEDDLGTVTEVPAVTTHAHRHHHGLAQPELTENKLELSNNNVAVPEEVEVGENAAAVATTNTNAKSDDSDLLLHKNSNIDEEIVESVSQLESVITKTIENTQNIKELPVGIDEDDEEEDVPVAVEIVKDFEAPNAREELDKELESKIAEQTNNLNANEYDITTATTTPTLSAVTSGVSSKKAAHLIDDNDDNDIADADVDADVDLDAEDGSGSGALEASAPLNRHVNGDVSARVDEINSLASASASVSASASASANVVEVIESSTTMATAAAAAAAGVTSTSLPAVVAVPIENATFTITADTVSSSFTTMPPALDTQSINANSTANTPLSPQAPSSAYDASSVSISSTSTLSSASESYSSPSLSSPPLSSSSPSMSPSTSTTVTPATTTSATILPIKDDNETSTVLPAGNQNATLLTTPEVMDVYGKVDATSPTTSSSGSSTSPTSAANTPTSTSTTFDNKWLWTPTDNSDPLENVKPMIRSRLPKLAVTSGKSFTFIVPEDTFYDAEDQTNLRLELTDKDGYELKPTSWLQFNAEKREIYGLPLDDAVSKWQYLLSATDSGNESVTETVEVSVQQHRGVRSVNHEISIVVKINEKNMHNIDWQLKLMRAIATTLNDANTSSIVVREIRQTPQNPNSATFVYFNESLPTTECPDVQSTLVNRFDLRRLNDLLHPTLSVISINGELIGSCKRTQITKPKPTINLANNMPPMPRNQVDRVNATVGHLLVFKVPGDTFYDPDNEPLTLTLKTKDRKELNPRQWLQFDTKNEEFYGIPKSGDIGSEEYLLVAEDSAGQTATDALVVVVNHAPKKEFSIYFKAYLAIRHEQFNADLQRKFVERISQLFGDTTTQNVQIRSVTTHHDSDGTIVNFYNTTLFKSHNRCPEEQIEAVRNVYLLKDYILRDNVKKALGPELNLTNMQAMPLGICHPQTDVTHREYVPTKTEEPMLKSTFGEEHMYTVILPIIIISVMIIIGLSIACCLHRRRRKSGKMELGDEEERKSFRTKGIPVIFQDELDEKPEIGNKSPIILKDEKPPLLPPSYNTSNMNGDNDVDEYVPPPAVVVGGREARGKSPATPSYRKPPPYVSP